MPLEPDTAPKELDIWAPSLLPTCMRPSVLTRQQSQPSTNFLEPIRRLTGEVDSFTVANCAWREVAIHRQRKGSFPNWVFQMIRY